MEHKQKIILGTVALFFFGSIVFFFLYKETPDQIPEPVTVATTTVKADLQTKTESLTHTSASIEMLVEYPQFTSSIAGSPEDSINSALKKNAQAVYDKTLLELKDSVSEIKDREVFFQKKLLKDKTYTNNGTEIVSFAYSQYINTGGAHGTFFYGSETIDIKTGQKLMLKDFLKGEYEAVLLKEIERQIRTSAATCLRCDSLAEELSNMNLFIPESFILSDQGITFLYSAYDLASYAATSNGQEVFVDKQILDPYILRVW